MLSAFIFRDCKIARYFSEHLNTLHMVQSIARSAEGPQREIETSSGRLHFFGKTWSRSVSIGL